VGLNGCREASARCGDRRAERRREIDQRRPGAASDAERNGVPAETVERRYYGGIRNFFELYQPLATGWRVYNNSEKSGATLIASGGIVRRQRIYRAKDWRQIVEANEKFTGEAR
jgi:hypothetical protein